MENDTAKQGKDFARGTSVRKQWKFSMCCVLMLAFVGSLSASAQQAESVGLRLGGGQVLSGEVAARWAAGANHVETTIGWSREGYHSDMGIGAVYQWNGGFGNGFGWFLGFGLHAAWQTWESGRGDRNVAAALLLQAGIEYRIADTPLSLTLDARPRLYVLPDSQPHLADVAIGIRYSL